jgi:hypothetical protein
MKNIKSILIAATATTALVFASCDKGETPGPDYTLRVVDFEAAELSSEGYLNDSSYEEKGLTFVNNYTVDGGYWNGFVFSNKTDKTTPGLSNQYSVYSTGGAGSSAKFAVCFDIGESEMSFASNDEYDIEYAYFNNSTYTYLAIKNGDDGNKPPYVKGPFEAGDWFKLTATGYDAAGTQTGTHDIYLADYRDGKSFLMADWTKVDLTSLGKVNKVKFSLDSSDKGDWVNTPTYFCIDNIAYRVYE